MSPQLSPRAAATSIRLLVRPVLATPLPVGVQRAWLRAATAGAVAAPGVTRDPGLLGVRPAEVHTPAAVHTSAEAPAVHTFAEVRGSAADPTSAVDTSAEAPGAVRTPRPAGQRAVLYLHGGAFTLGDPGTHRALCSHLAAASGARVHVLHYRRAPEAPYPAAVDDALDAYDDLRARGIAAVDLALVGDSAGGWLALTTAIRLRDRGSGPLGPLGLISPWVDLAVPPGGWRQDALLSAAWLRRSARMFLGGRSPADPALDLTRADLAGLPPTTLHVGTDEALLADARSLADRLRTAEIDLRYAELPGLWHVAQAQAGTVAAATKAVAHLAADLWRAPADS